MGPCQEALAGAAHLLNWVWVWSRLPRLAPSQQHSFGGGGGGQGGYDDWPAPPPPPTPHGRVIFLSGSEQGWAVVDI